MSRLLTDNIWNEIGCLSSVSSKKHVAVAYLTDASMLHLKMNDVLVVDASDRAIMTGQTSANALDDLFATGVRLYSQEGLHAKVYVFDASVVIGSANASLSSRKRLIEAAVLCDDADVVQHATSYVSEIARRAVVIDRTFVDRVLELPVERQGSSNNSQVTENDENEEYPASLWRLKDPPPARSKNMRSYFLALILSQLGDLVPNREFVLWNGHFRTHLTKNRMTRVNGSRYSLTETGVEYFSPDIAKYRGLIEQFLHAITTGDSSNLPADLKNKELHPITI